MKEEALEIISEIEDPANKLNLLREYLQALVLRSLHESEAFNQLSFVGGTALRFAFNLPRFSEDLDFSLEKSSSYHPEVWMKKIESDLKLASFNVVVSWNDRSTVHKAWIKISELLKEAGLAALYNQNLSIKLEIDTKPPAGASTVNAIITRHRILSIKHYDLPSLMAGKIHALTTRKYAKGRDWYDLLWYRAKRPPIDPNLVQLQNAFDQTSRKFEYEADKWKTYLLDNLNDLDSNDLVRDVQPFLEHQREANLLTKENLISVLSYQS